MVGRCRGGDEVLVEIAAEISDDHPAVALHLPARPSDGCMVLGHCGPSRGSGLEHQLLKTLGSMLSHNNFFVNTFLHDYVIKGLQQIRTACILCYILLIFLHMTVIFGAISQLSYSDF